VISWDLGLKLRKRKERYADEEANKRKNRVSSVWSLDLDEQGVEAGERTAGDGNNEMPWEMRWEIGEEDGKQVSRWNYVSEELGPFDAMICSRAHPSPRSDSRSGHTRIGSTISSSVT
jgi:hypothetical protein